MSGVNRVILYGQVKTRPLFEAGRNNQCKVSFELTTTEQTKYALDYVETHHIVMYNYTGFAAYNALSEGMLVYLEGSVTTLIYFDDSNIKRYDTRIHCVSFEILPQPLVPAA